MPSSDEKFMHLQRMSNVKFFMVSKKVLCVISKLCKREIYEKNEILQEVSKTKTMREF